MNYTSTYLDGICSLQLPVIVELKFDDVVAVGYFVRASSYQKGHYKVLPLDIQGDIWLLKKSDIKRIINTNGWVHPKTPNAKKYKILDIFELQSLLEKAGYTFQ